MKPARTKAVKPGAISGRVRDALGPPIDGVEITAKHADGTAVATVTKNGGLYSIRRLPPGGYVVSVRIPAGFFDADPVRMKLPAGGDVSDVDFRLRAKPSVPTAPTGPLPPVVTGPVAPPETPSLPVYTVSVATPPVVTPPVAGVTMPVVATGPMPSAPPVPAPPSTVTGPNAGGQLPSGIDEFRRLLLSDDLNIEGPIAEDEALEAIALFAVSNVLLAGLGRRRVGSEDKIDVLGVLTLYYGLQDKSLAERVVVNSRELWRASVNGGRSVEEELKLLRDTLDRLGQDVIFVSREAKRQFNLGVNNDVAANVAFPILMRRLVALAADARLTLNLRDEDAAGSFTSKEKIGEAYDLLAELKSVALQIVRSLSRYGTIATRRSNRDWAAFENRAFAVLKKAGEQRFTDDIDDRRILTVLADLLGKNFETVISPYFTMARNGTALLSLAFETYMAARSELADFDRDHLVTLFQQAGPSAAFLTTRMRSHALVLKRYPLQAWN